MDYESRDGKAPLHLRISPNLKRRLDEVIPRGQRDGLFDTLLEDLLPLLEGDKGPRVLAAIYERRLTARQILREAEAHGNIRRHETKVPRSLTRRET